MTIKLKSLITENFDDSLVKDLIRVWDEISSDYFNVFRQNADRYSKMALKNGIKGDEVANAVHDFTNTNLSGKSLSLWKTLKPGDKNKYLEKAFPKNKTYVAESKVLGEEKVMPDEFAKRKLMNYVKLKTPEFNWEPGGCYIIHKNGKDFYEWDGKNWSHSFHKAW
jgi:hypothetical protein